MELGDGVGGVDEIPRLPGETRPADPADSVLQGPRELPGVFHGLDMLFGFFALHLQWRRRRYYLAGERILGYRGKEEDRLNRVDLDISRKLQFVCVAADSALNGPSFFQSSFRASRVLLMKQASSHTRSPDLSHGAGRRPLS